MDVWRQMISAQGGDPDAKLPVARENTVVTAHSSGTILSMDAMKVGMAAWRLGAGRSRQGEAVQAGLELRFMRNRGADRCWGTAIYAPYRHSCRLYAGVGVPGKLCNHWRYASWRNRSPSTYC